VIAGEVNEASKAERPQSFFPHLAESRVRSSAISDAELQKSARSRKSIRISATTPDVPRNARSLLFSSCSLTLSLSLSLSLSLLLVLLPTFVRRCMRVKLSESRLKALVGKAFAFRETGDVSCKRSLLMEFQLGAY
jgi:hypothetical protein